jgi:hypothetical protein
MDKCIVNAVLPKVQLYHFYYLRLSLYFRVIICVFNSIFFLKILNIGNCTNKESV